MRKFILNKYCRMYLFKWSFTIWKCTQLKTTNSYWSCSQSIWVFVSKMHLNCRKNGTALLWTELRCSLHLNVGNKTRLRFLKLTFQYSTIADYQRMHRMLRTSIGYNMLQAQLEQNMPARLQTYYYAITHM